MNTTRRPKGTGSIIRTPEGKYRALFPFRKGKREDIDGSPFATEDEADIALAALLDQLRSGDEIPRGLTLRKLGDLALSYREREGYRSIDGDRDVWDLRVETWAKASLPARMTTTGDVRAWLAAMRNKTTGKPLATQTRRNALNVLRAVYAYGVEHELVDENPCDGIRVKDHGRTDAGSTFLTLAESTALIAAAIDPGVGLAIGSGLRSGELRSLHWEDVHDDHITVRFGRPGVPTKSGKTRDVPILPIARSALETLPRTHALVLPSITGTFRAKGQLFDRLAWKSWLKAAGLSRRVRPHDLRHTCATLLLTGAWGRAWTYEEVKEMLGHSSVKVTERYAKATGTLAQKAAAAMAEGSGQDRQTAMQNAAQAREIILRRGSDSNRRMTVLQSRLPEPDCRGADRAPILSRSNELQRLADAFVEAVASGDARAIARGLTLAEEVYAAAPVELAEVGS